MTLLPVVLLLVLASHGHGLGVEVEDVTGKQLEAALQTEQLLAVMFCKYLHLQQQGVSDKCSNALCMIMHDIVIFWTL